MSKQVLYLIRMLETVGGLQDLLTEQLSVSPLHTLKMMKSTISELEQKLKFGVMPSGDQAHEILSIQQEIVKKISIIKHRIDEQIAQYNITSSEDHIEHDWEYNILSAAIDKLPDLNEI